MSVKQMHNRRAGGASRSLPINSFSYSSLFTLHLKHIEQQLGKDDFEDQGDWQGQHITNSR
jgi:hypothetical protein